MLKRSFVSILLIILSTLTFQLFSQEISVVTEEYPPYNFTENNKITGFSSEVVEEVLRKAGLTYIIESYPWARTYNLAQTQENTLIYSIGRNAQRENLFKWVDIIAPYNVALFKLKENNDIKVETLEDAKNYMIGGVKDDVRAQYFLNNGFKAVEHLDLSSGDDVNLKKLFMGRIELLPIDELGLSHLAKQHNYDFSKLEKVYPLEDLSAGLYMAFSMKTEDSVVEKCKKALEQIKQDGTYEKISKKYLK